MGRFGFVPTEKDGDDLWIIRMEDYDYWQDIKILYNRINIDREMLTEEKKADFKKEEERVLNACRDYQELLKVYESLSQKVQALRG